MSKFFGYFFFNPLLDDFLKDYKDSFPECTHTLTYVLPQLQTLDPRDADFFLDMFLKHMLPLQQLTLARNSALLDKHPNLFLQHLEFGKVWRSTPADQRDPLWSFLIGCTLVANGVAQLPPKILRIADTIYLDCLSPEGRDRPLSEIPEAKNIASVTVDEASSTMRWTRSMLAHPDTPLYVTVQKDYHCILDMFINVFTSDTLFPLVLTLLPNIFQILQRKLDEDVVGNTHATELMKFDYAVLRRLIHFFSCCVTLLQQ